MVKYNKFDLFKFTVLCHGVAQITVLAVVYGIFAFISGTLDAGQWGVGPRAIAVLVVLFFSAMAHIAVAMDNLPKWLAEALHEEIDTD